MSPSFAPRASFVALAGLVAVAALSLSSSPSPARAGDPPASAVPAVTPRQAALEAVIHRLERHLAFLRKSRTELESGRPEPVPADDLARHRADVDRRGVREVSRYESARGRAVAALTEAEASKNAGRVGDAKTTLDTLDSKFVDTMKKLEESLDTLPGASSTAPPNPPKKATAGDQAPSNGDTTTPPKKASKPTGKSSSSESTEGSSSEDDSSVDREGDDDEGDDDGGDADGGDDDLST